MNTDPVTLTLPFLTWQGLNVILTALGIALAIGLVWLMLDDADRERQRTQANWLMALLVVMGVVWVLLLGATLWGLWQVFNGVDGAPLSSGSLGLGALIAAFLGAPFVIYGTYLRHKTNRLEQEGHMTDRINKAVEQLGADKIIERIGRPVKVWTGKPLEYHHFKPDGPPNLKARQRIESSEFSTTYSDALDDVVEGVDYQVKEWPQELTLIEWQGEGIKIGANDHIAEYGAWEVFKETAPSIEVRMGAILSLERIAQDSTADDNGRDHVRVMEILCAYIRENAPALDTSSDPFTRLDLDADYTQRNSARGKIELWIDTLQEPRTDIALALKVLGLRSKKQIEIEQRHMDRLGEPFKLDLRRTCLRRANLAGMNFENAILFRSQLEGAYCNDTNFSKANLNRAQFIRASMARANLSFARLSSTDFTLAIMDRVDMTEAAFQFTHFVESQLIGVRVVYKPEGVVPVNRVFFINSALQGALIEGDLRNGLILNNCSIELVAFRNAKLPSKLEENPVLRKTFGDATTPFNTQLSRPNQWPDWELPDKGAQSFDTEWRKWQANPDTYSPPPKPK